MLYLSRSITPLLVHLKIFYLFDTCVSSFSICSNMSHPRGAFIVFEGCDRSGKTTQSKKLVEYLNANNIPSEFMSFPDRTTATGLIINDYIKEKIELSDQAAHLLFSANRWERQPFLTKTLLEGKTIICDRYSFSGVAYTAAKKNIDMSWCFEPEKGLPKPDTVLLFKLSEEAMQQRHGFGNERYEKPEFQRKVANNYEKLKDDSWIDVNADKDIETLGALIKDIVVDKIKKVQFTSLSKL